MQQQLQAIRSYRIMMMLTVGCVIAFLVSTLLWSMLPPLTPFTAALMGIIKLSPVGLLLWFLLDKTIENHLELANIHLHDRLERMPANAKNKRLIRPFSKLYFNIMAVVMSVCVSIASAFTLNQLLDNSVPRITHQTILDKGYITKKHSKHYHAIIANPTAPLFSFIDSSTIEFPLREEDYAKIKPGITEIHFPLYEGALGLPWYKDYDYHLSKSGNAYNIHMREIPEEIKKDPRIAEACSYTRNYDVTQDIAFTTPDRFYTQHWPDGSVKSVVPLVNNERHGIEKDTFPNGQLYGEIPWKENRKHGVFTLFREDGSKEMTLSYREGKVYGINTWFDDNGNITSAWVYVASDEYFPASLCSSH